MMSLLSVCWLRFVIGSWVICWIWLVVLVLLLIVGRLLGFLLLLSGCKVRV